MGYQKSRKKEPIIGHTIRKKQIERNEITPSQEERNTPPIIFTITLNMKYLIGSILVAGILLSPTLPQAMEIRQEIYRFAMNMTQEVTCETFVIDEYPPFKTSPRVSCSLPVGRFELGSAVLSAAAGERIVSGLRRCGISQDDPLVVTGHTCEFGPEELNQTLSQQRAGAVAALLRKNGFHVAMTQGKGSQETISHDSGKFSVNRRVEIALQQRIAPLPSFPPAH